MPPVQNTVRSSTSHSTTGRSPSPSGTATRSKHCTIIHLTFHHWSKPYGQVALPPVQNTVRSSTSPYTIGKPPYNSHNSVIFLVLPLPPFKITSSFKQSLLLFLTFSHFNISIHVPRIIYCYFLLQQTHAQSIP